MRKKKSCKARLIIWTWCAHVFFLTLSTGIWFTLHRSKAQAVCKPCTAKDPDVLRNCVMFLWLTDYLRTKNTHCCLLHLHREITICSKHVIWMVGMCSSCGHIRGENHGFLTSAYETPTTSWCLDCTCGSSVKDHGACCPGNSAVSSFVTSVWAIFLRGTFYQLWILAAWTKIDVERKRSDPSCKITNEIADKTERPPKPYTIRYNTLLSTCSKMFLQSTSQVVYFHSILHLEM